MDDFPNLEACCGGKLNPENLKRFQKAMREYEVFMRGLNALFRPVRDTRDELDAH